MGTVGIRTVIAVLLLSIFIVFILQNTTVVDIRFLFWKLSLSRVILLLGALFTGMVIGIIIGWEAKTRSKS